MACLSRGGFARLRAGGGSNPSPIQTDQANNMVRNVTHVWTGQALCRPWTSTLAGRKPAKLKCTSAQLV